MISAFIPYIYCIYRKAEKFLIFLFVTALFCNPGNIVSGQNIPFGEMAENFYWEGEIDSAKAYYQKALDQELQGSNHVKIIELYLKRIYLLNAYDETEQAIAMFQEMENFKDSIHHNYSESEESEILFFKANVEIDQNNLKLAEDFLNKSLELYDHDKPSLMTANTYSLLGRINSLRTDFASALEYYTQSRIINEKIGRKLSIAKDLTNIGTQLSNLGRYEEALLEFEKANKYYQGHKNVSLAVLYNQIGTAHTQVVFNNILSPEKEKYKKNLDQADFYFNKAVEIYEHLGDYTRLSITMNNLAALNSHAVKYGLNDSYDKSLAYLKSALEIIQQNDPKNLAFIYNNLGRTYQHLKQYDSAITNYQNSIIFSTPGFTNEDPAFNPHLGQIIPDNNMLEIFENKANCFYELYNIDKKNTALLENSLNTFLFAIDMIDTIRIKQSINSKLHRAGLNKSTYYRAIQIANLLNQKTGEEKHAKKAFEICESSKALLLKELINNSRAQVFSNIDKALIEKEKNLKQEISNAQSELFFTKLKEKRDSLAENDLEVKIFTLKESLKELTQEFEENFPQYYSFKFEQSGLSLKEIQQKLKKNQSILEYFMGDTSVFLFYVDRDKFDHYSISIDKQFRVILDRFRKSMSTEPSYTNFQTCVQDGYFLYQNLIEPFKTEIRDKQLIIIPDGELGYIPFEVFQTKQTEFTRARYNKLPYLVLDYPVSYAYSADLLFNKRFHSHFSAHKVHAYAPLISNGIHKDSISLLSLPGTRNEIKSIEKSIRTKSFVDQEATETAFRKHLKESGVIHIATHGLINDINPLYSKLFFHPEDSINDGELNIYELYNMDINAELVVLSSCNTGDGELQRGEGIMSLARGFIYAGVPSILMTLWRLNDSFSAMLIETFYKNIKKGMSPNIALQNAKIDYLKHADNFQSNPLYWASYVNIGDTRPVFQKSLRRFILITIALALISAAGIVIIRKRKK